MDDNNLIKKTNEVISKQNEMNDLISDLKVEVLKTRKENRLLADKNLQLKSQLSSMLEKHDNLEVPNVILEAPEIVVQEEPLKTYVKSQVVTERPNITKEEKLVPKRYESVEKEQLVFKDSSINKAAIFEFFLGKNVIAKIAGVLITLGIFTFGRIAYVNWLSDIGRFALIFIVGAIIFGIGYLFDKKQSQLFSSIFYSIGLSVILMSLFLARVSYDLISPAFFISLTLIMIGAVFWYFRSKRYQFMDTMLILLYTTISTINILMGLSIYSEVPIMLLLTINALVFGFIIYIYYMNYYKNREHQMIIISLIIMIGMIVITIPLADSGVPFIYVIWNILTIAFAYIINLTIFSKVQYAKITIAVFTVILLVLASSAITTLVYELNIFNEGSFVTFMSLLFFVIALPVYMYLYDDEENANVEVVDVYGILITFSLLVFTFAFGASNSTSLSGLMFGRSILFGLELLVLFAISKYSKRSTHKLLFYMVLLGVGINLFLLITDFGFVAIEFIGYYLIGLFTAIALLFENNILSRIRNKEDLELNQTIKTFLLVTSMLVVLMLVDSLRDSIEDRFTILFIGAMAYTLIGFRHIITIKPLQDKHSKVYQLITELVLVTFVLLSNITYFDHDFSQSLDVITFIIILLPNIYIIYSLRNIFGYLKNIVEIDTEILFIIIYKSGVVIQSLFIHYFINFTYDKVLLSSYFMVAAAIGVLFGFKEGWKKVRFIGLGAIYFSLAKFFVYDFFTQDLSDTVRVITYISLGLVLLGISFLYSYLEKIYGGNEIV